MTMQSSGSRSRVGDLDRPAPLENGTGLSHFLTDAVLAELRAHTAELRAIRLLLEQWSHRPVMPSSLSRGDRAVLARLLPAIGGVLGSELFASADICESDAPALRLVRAGLTARQLGRLLRRAVGTPIAGYLVERVGAEAGVALWRVVAVAEFSGNEKVSVPHAARESLP